MSESKHTRGPWKFVSQAVTQEVDVFEIAEISHLRVICDGGGDGFSKAGTPEADARLIAAAPELLEALKALLNECDAAGLTDARDFNWPNVTKDARAAIAKATGEQK